MDLSEELYGDCFDILRHFPQDRVIRTRGPSAVLTEPLIWETVLMTVHFLCVVHALHDRDAFSRLAEFWRARRKQIAKLSASDPLVMETNQALKSLEDELHQEVIRPLQDQIEEAREAVHEILSSYAGTGKFPPETASEIVSAITATLQERTNQQHE